MASSVTLPTFEDEEILLYQKLNAMVDAIDAQFSAGIGAADIAWPMTAEGNLDMSTFEIINGKKIWGIVNVDEYGSGTDALALAVAAAGANGVTLVPPGVTITSAEPVTIPNGGCIVGSGPNSVLRLVNGASHGSLLNAASTSGHFISNLTLDGLSETGAGQNGITFAGVTNSVINKVHFKDFSGNCLELTSTCDRVVVSSCFFDDSAIGVYSTQCARLLLSDLTLDGQSSGAIMLACVDETTPIRATLCNIRINNQTNFGMRMLGANAPGGTSVAEIHIVNLVAQGLGASTGVQIGSAAASVDRVTWHGGNVNGGAAGGAVVNASWGTIDGVIFDNITGTCIDLDLSQHVTVSNCILADGAVGIDAGDITADCYVRGNEITGCTLDMVLSEFLYQYGNSVNFPGAVPYTGRVYFDSTVGASTTQVVTHIDIPADTMRVGSCLEVFAYGDWNNGGASSAVVSLRIGSDEFCIARYVDSSEWVMKAELHLVTASGTNARGFGMGVSKEVATLKSDGFHGTALTFDQTSSQSVTIYYTDAAGAAITARSWGWRVQHSQMIDQT